MSDDTTGLRRTPFYDQHVALGAKMVGFAGWEMPIQYRGGIVEEHGDVRAPPGRVDDHREGAVTFGHDQVPAGPAVPVGIGDGLHG